jgi:sialic acid synthase SpsE
MTEIVAEISGNHGGSIGNALRLIRAAAEAGADAVKFQCFDPERLAARRATRADVLALAGGVPLINLYRRIHTPQAWFSEMATFAELHGLFWFSSVFDPADVAFLETLGCPRYKISAFEMLDWDIIKAVRETGKPIVMSVRPMPPELTILLANKYDGEFNELGVSWHAPKRDELGSCAFPTNPGCPMVEYHLRLPDVTTPDCDFSITPDELREIVGWLK